MRPAWVAGQSAGAARWLWVPALAALVFLAGSALARAGGVEVVSFQETVSQMDRARAFYTGVLPFQWEREIRTRQGTTATIRLGAETVLLFAPAKVGGPVPAGMTSNDRLFEHLAIVVSDMDAADRRLVSHGVSFVSTAPQTLPSWNKNAAGIRAVYFRDPDGHFLELIQFPDDKGRPQWHRHGGPLFLGIDHSAIGVSDTRASLHFYRDLLGLKVVGQSFNYGVEQDRLSGVLGARVRITGLRGASGPGVELLQYETPGLKNAAPGRPAADDLLHWTINLEAVPSVVASVLRGIPAEEKASSAGGVADLHDPDGHDLVLSAHR